jgi:uncharacterized protein YidB (DUF937 family)
VNTWRTGPNLPTTSSQIEQGLGGNLLDQLWPGKAGLSSGAASSQLASLLRDLVNKLTPNGKSKQVGSISL